MANALTLQSLGAAGTVTGSKHLVTNADRRILLDCGLFQGLKPLRERNWRAPQFDPAKLDAVVLSHAHIDHSGNLPLIVRQGFRGPIYCTPATRDLLAVLLRDSAHLQEEEAERANRYGYSRHRPALPLYTSDDAEAALNLLVPKPYVQRFDVTKGVTAVFRLAGHILGSASIELGLTSPPNRPRILAFSGDLGRYDQPILPDPEPIPDADTLLIESTYGDRVHPPNPMAEVARVVRDCAAHGGVLLVPAFAVGRTQELLWILRELEDQGQIPALPVYVDSPMAVDVTEIYQRHPEDHDIDLRTLEARGRSALRTKHLQMVRTSAESQALNRLSGPIIIISASGMATGGRILHHLKLRLPDPRTTALLVGFQAAGTRGRMLQDGARSIRMLGEEVQVRATVEQVEGLSAHADREETLRWLSGFKRPPDRTYLVHGEGKQAESLRALIQERLGWKVSVAQDGEVVDIGG